MRYTTLNNNEIIPNLGTGTYRISPADAERAVEHALRNGYQLIDTANIYMSQLPMTEVTGLPLATS